MRKTFRHKRIRFVERIRKAIFSIFRNEIMKIVTPYINQQDFYVTKTLDFERLVSEFEIGSAMYHDNSRNCESFILRKKEELAMKAVDFIIQESCCVQYPHVSIKDTLVRLSLFIGKPNSYEAR